MECPKCESKHIFYVQYKPLIRNNKNQIIGSKPQYKCLDCNSDWDVNIKNELFNSHYEGKIFK